MKKVFQTKLKNITKVLVLVIVASLATFTGCKSYDNDITGLQTQIDAVVTDVKTLKDQVTALQASVNGMTYIKTITLGTDGKLTITPSAGNAIVFDAKSYVTYDISLVNNVLMVNGVNKGTVVIPALTFGTDGKLMSGTTVVADLTGWLSGSTGLTLGTDNYLYINGKKTTVLIPTGYVAPTPAVTVKSVAISGNTITFTYTDGTTKDYTPAATAVVATTGANGHLLINGIDTGVMVANTYTVVGGWLYVNGVKTDAQIPVPAENKNLLVFGKDPITGAIITTTIMDGNGNTFTIKLNPALNSRLTSLEFVADFNVNGIAAMNFSPLLSQCTAITPTVTVGYHLNPSFVTKDDIDFDRMAFVVLPTSNLITLTGYYPAKKVATPPIRIRATFDRIENGIIYVKVNVDDVNVLLGTGVTDNIANTLLEKFNSIALQIPISQKVVTNPADSVITSAYVRLYSQNILASNISLVRTIPTHPAYLKTLAFAEALTVAGIDGGLTTDPTVVTLPYGQSLNLADQVLAWYNGSAFDVVKYGLNFKFDLLNESGATFTYIRNTVDQETLIQITDAAKGTITANPATTPATITLSQGRTPIVRVTMYNSQDPTCPVLMAFIKIRFEETPPVIHTFTIANQVVTCDDNTYTVPEDSMLNAIYSKIKIGGMTKTQFLAAYPNAPVLTGDPTVSPVTATTSLGWTLTASSIWTRLNVSDPATFTATVVYTPTLIAINPTITITLTRTFTKPAVGNIAAASLISNYWYTDLSKSPYPYVKHNVYVPDVNEAVTTRCLFFNNINQAFEENANNSLKLPTGLTNYQYYFRTIQPTLAGPTGNVTLTPSSDGQTLLNGLEIVATINPFAANLGDILVLNQSSPMAKKLLNYTADPTATKGENLVARLGIRTLACPALGQISTMPVTVNGNPYFDVVFVRPINAQPGSGQHFVDALNFGDPYTYIDIAKLVNLYDWRYSDPVASFATHANYYGYYGVTAMTADVANITTDLNQAAGVKVLLTQYPDVRVAWAASMNGVTPAYGYLTYNNTGNTLNVLFNLYVPVTVTYYWGQIVSATIQVPVWKTVGQSGVKAMR